MSGVSRVRSSVPAAAIAIKPRKSELQRVVKASKIGLDVTTRVAKTSVSLIKVVDAFRKVSKDILTATKGVKILSVLSTPFVVKNTFDEIFKLSKAKDVKDKIRGVFKLITHVDGITESVASACSLLEFFKCIPSEACEWIPIFNIVSYAVGFISLGLKSESVHHARKFKQGFDRITKKFAEAKSQDAQRAVLLSALEKFKTDGIEPLRKKLEVSKKANLAEKIDVLSARLFSAVGKEKERAIKDSKQFIDKLRSRARLQLGLKVFELVKKIVTIVGITLFFVPCPPCAIIGAVLLGTTAVAGCVTMGGRFFFFNKNPFDPDSKTRARILLEKIAKGLEKLRRALSPPHVRVTKTARTHGLEPAHVRVSSSK